MGMSFLIITGIALSALFLTLKGLLSNKSSVLAVLSGGIVAAMASAGAKYAWIESHSPEWTVIYSTIALIGLVSVGRQMFMLFQQAVREEALS